MTVGHLVERMVEMKAAVKVDRMAGLWVAPKAAQRVEMTAAQLVSSLAVEMDLRTVDLTVAATVASLAADSVDRSVEKMVEDSVALMADHSAGRWGHCWADGMVVMSVVMSADEMVVLLAADSAVPSVEKKAAWLAAMWVANLAEK